MKHIIPFILILGIVSCQQKTGNPFSENRLDKQTSDSLTTVLQALHDRGHINGFAVALVDEQGLVYQKGFGWANVEKKKPYTVNTLHRVCSVSKTFMGVSLLKAQEQGKLKLDDPVNQYLPFKVQNPHHPEEEITIRDLTQHTSTLQDGHYHIDAYYTLDSIDSLTSAQLFYGEYIPYRKDNPTLEEYLRERFDSSGKHYSEDAYSENKPGEKFQYSNLATSLGALVIKGATGMTFKAFSRKYIFEPLEMNASGWSRDEIDAERHAELYFSPDTLFPHYSYVDYPSGGLISSTADMSRYLSELIKGHNGKGMLLTKESYDELFAKNQEAYEFPEEALKQPVLNIKYDKGIFMGLGPDKMIGHTGGDPGIVTFMFFNAESRQGRYIQINTDVDQEGLEELLAIWDTLEAFQPEGQNKGQDYSEGF